jgi:hypothetical protein
MPEPVRYRNVFLFVSGRTPQIITETFFFFLRRHRPAIRPHEVQVLTTSEGYTLIVNQLLDPKTGQFYRFCRVENTGSIHARFTSRQKRSRSCGTKEESKKRFLQVCARIKRKVREVLGEASSPYMAFCERT